MCCKLSTVYYAGLAVPGRDVELFPFLNLLSEEIFV
jgi:hypothetical protein